MRTTAVHCSAVEEICVRMSLVKITEEEETDKEEKLEEGKRRGREGRVCYPGMGVNKLAGEEMMEGMERMRKNRPGRGMSIMNEVSVIEKKDEENSYCCVCQ